MFAAAYWDGEGEEEEEAMTPTLGLEMVQLFPREEDERTEEGEEEEEIVCRMKKRDQVPLLILYFPEQTSSVWKQVKRRRADPRVRNAGHSRSSVQFCNIFGNQNFSAIQAFPVPGQVFFIKFYLFKYSTCSARDWVG